MTFDIFICCRSTMNSSMNAHVIFNAFQCFEWFSTNVTPNKWRINFYFFYLIHSSKWRQENNNNQLLYIREYSDFFWFWFTTSLAFLPLWHNGFIIKIIYSWCKYVGVLIETVVVITFIVASIPIKCFGKILSTKVIVIICIEILFNWFLVRMIWIIKI